jgi:hypothetical protein
MLGAEDLGKEILPYAAVILNNSLWRDVFARIPFDRRLLLLPQCLRNSEKCTAPIDDYGLQCRRCGLCLIGPCIEEAERLGYVCLVAEGAVVVMSLIESGKVEAVVGVSCIESLEKVFPYMHIGAVPGIAVPLLNDGCCNTTLDIDRLWDAIYLSDEEKAYRLNLESIRDRIDAWFTPEAVAESFPAPSGDTERIALDWLAVGGKRWRPFLAVCAHEALNDSTGDDLPHYLRSIALAVECFHKASLIHDDIEDEDETRYGRKTLHMEYGIPIALNVGDLLIGEGYRLLSSADLPPEVRGDMVLAAAEAHRDLCTGQGEELFHIKNPEPLSVDEVLSISRFKTAPAFEVALRLGCLAAGSGCRHDPIIGRFSKAVGIAYQIRDDLLDRHSDGGPSITRALAAETDQGEQDVEHRARRLMEQYKAKALASLVPLRETGLKILLHRVVAKIFYDFETMGCCDDNNRRNGQAGGRRGL